MNYLNEHLKGQFVVLCSLLHPAMLEERLFYCMWGDGTNPTIKGDSIMGLYVYDNALKGIKAYEVERMASPLEAKIGQELMTLFQRGIEKYRE